jgi:hypothetical protein
MALPGRVDMRPRARAKEEVRKASLPAPEYQGGGSENMPSKALAHLPSTRNATA